MEACRHWSRYMRAVRTVASLRGAPMPPPNQAANAPSASAMKPKMPALALGAVAAWFGGGAGAPRRETTVARASR